METELELTFSLQVPCHSPGASLTQHSFASSALGAGCEGGTL